MYTQAKNPQQSPHRVYSSHGIQTVKLRVLTKKRQVFENTSTKQLKKKTILLKVKPNRLACLFKYLHKTKNRLST